MNSLVKLAALIVWMVLAPALTGLLPCSLLPRQKRTPGVLILAGYFMTFAVFELIALPILLFTYGGDFHLLTRVFSVVSVFMAVLGFVLCGGAKGLSFAGLTDESEGQGARIAGFILWAVFGVLLLFELYMAFTNLFFDGDDAYYAVSSVITSQKGTMYRVLPYTGGSTKLDVRHALALFPMWISYIAGIAGMHPTAVTHSVMPLLMIPLADLSAACAVKHILRREVFDGKRSAAFPLFMILTALLQIFGNVSIYTPETFLMMRSWQGKSLFVNFIIPAVFWMFLWAAELYGERPAGRQGGEAVPQESAAFRREKRFIWIMLALMVVTGGLSSSMAVVMTMGLIWLCGFFISLAVRKAAIFRGAVLSCIPGCLYVLLFLYLLKTLY